ncbi:hypothetical protein AVEN_181260-1 [Araneus ventricosus]|uniref:Uncharacterized protein n=1 Tax=Araneus ventricosus TaxID=182803 RepID=A0A4Y2MS23_ARAVE|nr:hypothetical protein AVEN_181260-1 [Araneus ventricosus]
MPLFECEADNIKDRDGLVAKTLDFATRPPPFERLGFGTGGFQVRNPIPPKIRCAWGSLHAKPYAVAKRSPAGVGPK